MVRPNSRGSFCPSSEPQCENPVMETAIAKTLATEYNLAVADMAMQVMGGAGYMMGPIARLAQYVPSDQTLQNVDLPGASV